MNKGSISLVIVAILLVGGLVALNSYMYDDTMVETPSTVSPNSQSSTTPDTQAPSKPSQPTPKPSTGSSGSNSGANGGGNSNSDGGMVACTMDAMMCPDGSYVGRQGPKCEFAPCPTSPAAQNEGDISLGVGQAGIFTTLNIKVNSFIQDSRCPIDAICIQAGSVSANVTLNDGIRSETVTLESNQPARVFGNYRINLSYASPSAQSTRQLAPGDYTFVFHIVRL